MICCRSYSSCIKNCILGSKFIFISLLTSYAEKYLPGLCALWPLWLLRRGLTLEVCLLLGWLYLGVLIIENNNIIED